MVPKGSSARREIAVPTFPCAAAQGWLDRICRGVAYAFGLAALGFFLLGIPIAHLWLPAVSPTEAAPVLVRVQPGSTARDVGLQLEEQGIVRSARHFVLASRLLGFDNRLQAGEYALNPGLPLFQIVGQLEQGQVATVRVTIPEGSSLRDIAEILARRGLVDVQRFLWLASDKTLVYGQRPPVEIPIASLEGYLFPDTYVFARGMGEEHYIRRMVARFVEVAVPVIRSQPAPLGLDLHEVVTLASIIEKEALLAREQPVIASVFFNRLRIGKLLQADPTVKYAMEVPPVRLLYQDLRIDSPYNTYLYPGLPPGPIASPGLSAMQAVLQPAQTDFYYFVARGDGTHVFTRTHDAHVRAKQAIVRGLR